MNKRFKMGTGAILATATLVAGLHMAVGPALAATSSNEATDIANKYRRPTAGWVNSLRPKGKPAASMILAEEGKTDYQILIPSSPTTMEEKAAADMAHWLQAMTGAEFPVVKEKSDALTGRVIRVGNTDLRKAFAKEKKDLSFDGQPITLSRLQSILRWILRGLHTEFKAVSIADLWTSFFVIRSMLTIQTISFITTGGDSKLWGLKSGYPKLHWRPW